MMPVVARPLDVRPLILWILAALIEEKTKSNGKKRRKRGRKAHRDILSFLTFFLLFSFSIFLDVICGERVYVGRPPEVGVRPSSGGKQEEKEQRRSGFSFIFHQKQSMEPDRRRE
jgi:hypothetical protein